MMTDSTLQRVWDAREAISRRCDYDAHKLVRFYQSRQKSIPAGDSKQKSSFSVGYKTAVS